MYRIISKGRVISLDATLTGSINFSSRTTDRPIQNGKEVADHRVVSPNTFSLNGIVSDFKVLTGESTTTAVSFIELLREVHESQETFTFEAIGNSSFLFPNCVFDSLKIENTQKYGKATFGDGNSAYAFLIDATIKQVKKATKARFVAEKAESDALSGKTKGSGVTAKPDDEKTEKKRDTMWDTANRIGGNLDNDN